MLQSLGTDRSVRMTSLKPTSMIVFKIVGFILVIIELAASLELADEEYPYVARNSSGDLVQGASSSSWDLTKTSSPYAPEDPELIYERTITELRVTHEVVHDRNGNPVKKFHRPIWRGLKNVNEHKTYTNVTKSIDDNDKRKEPLKDSTEINGDIEFIENSKIDGNNQRQINNRLNDLMNNRLSEFETKLRKGGDDDNDDDDRIIFMDSDEMKVISRNAFVPNLIDNECDGTTLCKKMKTYPRKYIESIVKNMSNLLPFSGIDEVNKIETRFQDSEGDRPLCQSEESTHFFEGARKDLNDPNSWHLVVNVKDFLQGIRVNKCLNSTRGCTVLNSFVESDLPNYNTFCKQQYIHHKLVVISRENGTPIVESFPIPSGCCCHIIFRTESRFGEIGDPATKKSNTNNNDNNKNNKNNNNNDNNDYHNYYNYRNDNDKNNNDTSKIKILKKWWSGIKKGVRGKKNQNP